jgi:hypothetical protein
VQCRAIGGAPKLRELDRAPSRAVQSKHDCALQDERFASRAGVVGCIFSHMRLLYDCLGGANARFLQMLTNNFLGS